jgi:hypothetical protein
MERRELIRISPSNHNHKNQNTMKTATNPKRIHVSARTWFDRVNGNTYHAAIITVNEGMKNETVIKVPFTYGYDRAFIQSAADVLRKAGRIKMAAHLWNLPRYCKENRIKYTEHLEEVSKSTLKNFTK